MSDQELSDIGLLSNTTTATLFVSTQGTGTSGFPGKLYPLDAGISESILRRPTATAVSGSDSVLISQGGTLKLAAASLLPGGGGGGGFPAVFPIVGGQALSSGAWQRPALTDLAWINQSAATATDVSGGPISFVKPNGTAFDFAFLGEAPSNTSSFTLKTLVSMQAQSNQWRAGVGIVDTSGSGTLVFVGWHCSGSGAAAGLIVDRFTGINSGVSSFLDEPVGLLVPAFNPPAMWIETSVISGTMTLAYSFDDESTYTTLYSGGSLLTTAAEVGITGDALGTSLGGLGINFWAQHG